MPLCRRSRRGGPGSWALALALAACGSRVQVAPTDAGEDASISDASTSEIADEGDSPARERERCNGRDDDLDGRVDEGCPVRVSANPSSDAYPSVSEGVIAWRCGQRVCFHRLPDGPVEFIASTCESPWVSRGRIACLVDGAGPARHHLVVRLDTGRETVVPAARASTVLPGHIDGDTLVWSQSLAEEPDNYEVFAHDLRAGRTQRLTDSPAAQTTPVVRGDTVVWNDERHARPEPGMAPLDDLYVAAPAAPSSARRVTTHGRTQQFGPVVDVYGGQAMLTEYELDPANGYRAARCHSVLVDLASGAVTALTELSNPCHTAKSLSERWAVVEWDSSGDSDLYLVDRSPGEAMRRVRVTQHSRRSTAARIEGPWLVWQDDRNDQWDIYRMDLTDFDAGDFSPEGVTP